ncbi:MAG: efflux RND transporter periplasmic adaptor subunit, partial [Pseudomonadota bacterium]
GAGQSLTAVVRAALPQEDSLTRTRIVRLRPDWAGVDATAGQSVIAHIPIGAERDALTVSKDAVLSGASGPFVYVDDDGTAAIRPVRLGAAIGDRFEALEGLAEGDRVVVRGNEGLSPGRPLQPAG